MGTAVIVAGLVAWVLVLLFFRSHRNWLPYYVVGSVGLAFALIGVGHSLVPLEPVLKTATAFSVHQVANLANVPTRLFPAVPGALMVLVIPQNAGWTVLNIGIESSGLLEMSVIVGMVGFYPGWSPKKRGVAMLLGLLAIYVANVLRIAFIVGTLHWMGKDALFISHTVLGRVLFFVMVVAIFWFLLSLPTLRSVHRKIQEEARR